MNAGPMKVRLRAWPETKPKGDAEVEMLMFPGSTRSISGSLIRAYLQEEVRFAALG